MLPVSPPLPAASARPPPVQPEASRFERFRVVRHKHCLPGPRVLLPHDYHGITGDTHATTRNLGPLALAFTKAGLAVAPPLTQIFFSCGVGMAWGFGVRQSIHSSMLQTRVLRALRQQKRTIRETANHLPAAAKPDALLSINRTRRAEAEVRRAFGGVVASAAGAGTGLGWLFRAIAVGTHTTALAHVALPILSTFFPVLGLSNAGLAIYEAVACAKTFAATRRAKRATWPQAFGREPVVKNMLHARHIERRWCHFGNAATHALVAVGAPLTFFVGPVGFSVLVPGVLGNLAVDVADQRIIHYPSQLSWHQQLRLGDQAALHTEIVRAQAQYRLLHRLRRERHALYPRGLGINLVRPFAQVASSLRRLLRPANMQQQAGPEPILARIASEQSAIARQHFYDTWRLQMLGHQTAYDLSALHAALKEDPRAWQPHSRTRLPALYALLRENHLCEPFAKRVLEDRALRKRTASQTTGRIIRLHRKRWCLNVSALLTQSPALNDAAVTDKLLAYGEEVLLVQGKNAAMYRRRQLLDLLDAQLKQDAHHGTGRRQA